eukprot:3755867-Pleurochrysis_carterae.AAC.1
MGVHGNIINSNDDVSVERAIEQKMVLSYISLGPSEKFRVNVGARYFPISVQLFFSYCLPARAQYSLCTLTTLRTSSSGSAAARCPSEAWIESAVACELLLSPLSSQSFYKALSAEFFPFTGSFELILDTAGMSQTKKTAKNRTKLSELCEGADVPVDYLCFLTHNMRARLDVSGKIVDVGVGRGTASGDAVLLPAALCKTMLVSPTPDNPIAPVFDAALSGTYDSSSDDYDECDDDGPVLEDNDAHQLSLAQ